MFKRDNRGHRTIGDRPRLLTSFLCQDAKEKNLNYLAHEYFNRDWLPMPFSKMAEWLAPAKLDYACSANYLDHIDALKRSAEQQAWRG